MSKNIFSKLQSDMQALGFYEGDIDGDWGPRSQAAWDATVGAAKLRDDACLPPDTEIEHKVSSIAWSIKVSQTFVDRVIWMASALKMPEEGPNWLMACMAWESNETFSPAVINMAGSGATGVIQFMPATAVGLGTTTKALSMMSAEDQLNYVYKYFLPYRGRLNNLGDVYMAILWPAGIGKADDWVLWSKEARPTTFRQNAGLDVNKDGVITRAECIAKVKAKLDKGMLVQNRR